MTNHNELPTSENTSPTDTPTPRPLPKWYLALLVLLPVLALGAAGYIQPDMTGAMWACAAVLVPWAVLEQTVVYPRLGVSGKDLQPSVVLPMILTVALMGVLVLVVWVIATSWSNSVPTWMLVGLFAGICAAATSLLEYRIILRTIRENR
ncbi:hypothetical protein [Pseudonocardia sp. TRM90224]|uniref:hypothetical protein n=1 Tax=Pseudonocardia sp. TRM90224 TaxID=2812678 RepID=UPI001E43E131|nr:hypothetical protein [Pseudonocardia sp. TRM90224]